MTTKTLAKVLKIAEAIDTKVREIVLEEGFEYSSQVTFNVTEERDNVTATITVYPFSKDVAPSIFFK